MHNAEDNKRCGKINKTRFLLTLTLTACVAASTRARVAIDVVSTRAVHAGATIAFIDIIYKDKSSSMTFLLLYDGISIQLQETSADCRVHVHVK